MPSKAVASRSGFVSYRRLVYLKIVAHIIANQRFKQEKSLSGRLRLIKCRDD